MKRAFCKVSKLWEALFWGAQDKERQVISRSYIFTLPEALCPACSSLFPDVSCKGSTNINNVNKTNKRLCLLPSESSLGPMDSFTKIHVRKTCLQKQIKYVITNALHLSGLGDQLKASLHLNVCSTVVTQQSRATQAPGQMNPHHAA